MYPKVACTRLKCQRFLGVPAEHESANLFWKRPDSICFRVYRPVSAGVLALEWKSSQRQFEKERAWLCPNKSFFMDTEM